MDLHLKEKLHTLPTSSGVYLMKDKDGNVIYVGKAINLKRRVTSYFIGNNKPIKTFNLVQNIVDFDYILTATETDAFMLENNLIKKYQPHFNILLKDGKNFPYLRINLNENFPKLEITRKVKNDGAKYFGPYFNGISPEQILKIVSRAFKLRTCNLNFSQKIIRPCLNYEMGLCDAPCAKYISKEEYSKKVNSVVEFLKGDTKLVEQLLFDAMRKASDMQNYEKALEIREEIKSLNHLKQKYTTQFSKLDNLDAIGYYSSGTKAVFTTMIIRNGKLMAVENFPMVSPLNFELEASQFLTQYYNQNRIIPGEIILPIEICDKSELEEFLENKSDHKVKIDVAQKGRNKKLCSMATLNGKDYLEKSLGILQTREMKTMGAIYRLKDVLGLHSVPYRMECYDISNISGVDSVASMVVFINGEPAKKHYRKFKIKTVVGANDYASLEEVLTRRVKRLKEDNDESFSCQPNLIVIDGGKGQLSVIKGIVERFSLDLDCCSIAKQDEDVFILGQEKPIHLARNDVALQVLQRIRDESHRFAITFHRNTHKNTMVRSVLDEISGIGPKKKELLFEKFENIEGIKNASTEEIMLIKGITENQAVEIKKILNK